MSVENQISGIYKEIHALSERVAKLEASRETGAAPTTFPSSTSTPPAAQPSLKNNVYKDPENPFHDHDDHPFRDSPNPHDHNPSADTSHILAIIGSICFIFASAFLIKLAIDSGWLTPIRQVGFSGLIGFALIAVGFLNIKKDSAYFSQLPAAGVVVLYMTVFGGALYHGIFDEMTAMYLAVGVSAIAIGLQIQLKQDIFVFIAITGTYAIPGILGIQSGPGVDRALFFLLWNVVFITLSILQRQRIFMLLAAYFAIGIFVANHPATFSKTDLAANLQAALNCFLQLALFAAGTSLFSLKNRMPLTQMESWACFPILLFVYGIEYTYIHRVYPEAVNWIALGVGAGLFLLFEFTKRSAKNLVFVSGPVFHAFLAIVIFHSFYLNILPDQWRPWFGLMTFGGLAAISFRPSFQKEEYRFSLLILLAVVAIEYLTVATATGQKPEGGWVLQNLLYASALGSGYILTRSKTPGPHASQASKLMLTLANVQATIFLTRSIHLLSLRLEFRSMASFAISASWTMFAIALLMISLRRKDATLAYSSLAVLAISVVKVFLLDMSGVGTIARILSLLTLGAAMYLGGYLFRYVKAWEESPTS